MGINAYQEQGLLFNTNFLADVEGGFTYRGDLILIEGEVGDDHGRRKPPVALMLGVLLLEQDKKLTMVIGLLHDLALLETFSEKYDVDLADEPTTMIFVRNVKEAFRVELGGKVFNIVPRTEGVPWNEAIEELAMEKSDFKGQSAGEKLLTLYGEAKGYKAGSEVISFADAMAKTVEVKVEARGAV